MGEPQEVRSIELSAEMVSRIEDRTSFTDFDTVEDYITHVLEEVLFQVEQHDVSGTDEVNEQDVRDRLELLGYLNE